MQKQTSNVVIVGGGTAGWSTAALLTANPDINVTVIEPSDIPTIGVGESTIPFINTIHQIMKMDIFDTPDWIKEVNGTLKFSIEFANFHEKERTWIHPFTSERTQDDRMTNHACNGDIPLEIYKDQDDFVIDNYCFPNLCAKQFTPYYDQNKYIMTPIAGYHVDAVLYADLLKRESTKRENCNYIDNSVKDIIVINDKIEKLVLKDNSVITADLFVDCTGFRALLANAVGSKWDDSYKERLFVDTALAVQLPYLDESKQMRNTTYCHALDYGWVWNVPLQTRIGTGYIYSSRYTTEEAATEEFKNHLHNKYGYAKEDLTFRKVPFDVGMRPEAWKNNVVAIGLSSFFLEPIESTAIAHLQHQANTVLDMLSAPWISDENKRKRFNSLNKSSLDAIASYIEQHYIFSNRKDTQFWKDITSIKLTDDQKDMLKTYTDPNLPFTMQYAKTKYGGHSLFSQSSYMFLFLGYDIAPNQMTDRVREYLS